MKYIILFILLTMLFVRVIPHNIHPTDLIIDLGNVRTLTFYKDKFTTNKQTFPISQPTCIKGELHNSGIIEIVQCKNNENDDCGNLQWKCTTNITKNYKLGATTISCEDCFDSKDKYKLVGSCGLKYEPMKKISMIHATDYTEETILYITSAIIGTIFCIVLSLFCNVAINPDIPHVRHHRYYNPYTSFQ